MPWHVTNCLTPCANGKPLRPRALPPQRGKGKAVRLTITGGILDGDKKNLSGTGVLVTKNGSMERKVFREWARHFVKQLGHWVLPPAAWGLGAIREG